MDLRKGIWLLLCCCLVACSACMDFKQPSNRIEYYTLEYDLPRIEGLRPVPASVRIERFSSAPEYNTSQIMYRDQAFMRNAYAYHRWRANPADLVSSFLGRDMKGSGLFGAVFPRDTRITPAYLLEGSVDEFLEWDADTTWKAMLGISVTLLREGEPDMGKRIVFQKSYRANRDCEHRNPQALAEAMSRAMAEVSGRIVRDVHSHLARMIP